MLFFLLTEILVLIAVTPSFVSPVFPSSLLNVLIHPFAARTSRSKATVGYLLLSKPEVQCSYGLVSQPPF